MQKIKTILSNFISAINNNPVDEWLIVRRKKIFVLSFLILIAWQTIFFVFQFSAQQKFTRHDATGFNHWWAQEFVYFYYYKSIFPLATTVQDKEFSESAADKIIKEQPRSLRMEWHHWVRFGESARILLYLPHCWITGSAKHPNIKFFNGILFIAVLCWLLHTFWKMQKPFLGMLMVFILGSSPTLIFENYNNNNVFGLMATWALILFCFHVQWFDKVFRWKYFLIAVACGVMAGVIYNVRAETGVMSLACPVLYFFAWRIKWMYRFFLIVGFMAAFIFILSAVQKHFRNKFDETYALVKRAGGVPFDGLKTIVHPLWHPLYCGLGDFDTKYGRVWHDTAVNVEILPILRKRTGQPLKYPGRTIYEMGEYYDPDSFYYKKPETLEGYDELVKEKYFSAVKSDPLWYAGILLKRANKFFGHTAPLAINLGLYIFVIPFSGYFLLILVWVLIYHRQWNWLKFLLFTLPLGIATILVFYSEHNSYQSVYHFFVAALIVYGIVGMKKGIRNMLVKANYTKI